MTSRGMRLLCVLVLHVLCETALGTSFLPQDPCPNNFFYDALYDLEFGTACTSPFVTVQTPFEGTGCDLRGTLKIVLEAKREGAFRRAVLLDLFFNANPIGYSFHVGDSVSNGGLGGDKGHTDYNSELHPVGNRSLRIYNNEKVAGAITIDNIIDRRLTLFIKDEKVQWVSDLSSDFIEGPGLFALGGQSDDPKGGNVANYDIFLGLNKVVRWTGRHRYGSGLCKVGIKFLPEGNSLYDAKYDLRAGDTCHSRYVTEHNPLVGTGCDTQGVLKITLASAIEDSYRRAVLVDLFFDNPRKWSFNLGDSPSNNGYGGDSTRSEYDCEIHSLGNNGFRVYRGDKLPGRKKTVSNSITVRLTLIIRDGAIQWITEGHLRYIQGPGLFALNGQSDDNQGNTSPNYDIYLGLNKVIHGYERTGSGLCAAAIKFLPELNASEGDVAPSSNPSGGNPSHYGYGPPTTY